MEYYDNTPSSFQCNGFCLLQHLMINVFKHDYCFFSFSHPCILRAFTRILDTKRTMASRILQHQEGQAVSLELLAEQNHPKLLHHQSPDRGRAIEREDHSSMLRRKGEQETLLGLKSMGEQRPHTKSVGTARSSECCRWSKEGLDK